MYYFRPTTTREKSNLYHYLKKRPFRRWKFLIWADAASTLNRHRVRLTKAKYFRRTKKKKATKLRNFTYTYIYWKTIFCVNISIKDKFLWFRKKKKKKKKARLKHKLKKPRRKVLKLFSRLSKRMPFDFLHFIMKRRPPRYGRKFLTRAGIINANNAKLLEWKKVGKKKAAKLRKSQNPSK